MKTRANMGWLVGAVVAGHCGLVALLILLPGCGKTVDDPAGKPDSTLSDPVPLPKTEPRAASTPSQKTGPIADAKSWQDTTAYVVAPGDTLSGLAKRAGVSADVIMAMNGIKDPNKIKVGQKIVLPGKVDVSRLAPARKPSAAKPSVEKPAASSGGEGVYVVKSGDSLARIANRNKVSVKAIKDANHLKSDAIIVGQKLTIPAAGQGTAPKTNVAPAAGVPLTPTAPAPAANRDAVSPAVGAAAPVPAAEGTHVVEEGEDIRSIAMKNMVSVSELRKVNRLSDTDEVKPGQVLKLPLSE